MNTAKQNLMKLPTIDISGVTHIRTPDDNRHHAQTLCGINRSIHGFHNEPTKPATCWTCRNTIDHILSHVIVILE